MDSKSPNRTAILSQSMYAKTPPWQTGQPQYCIPAIASPPTLSHLICSYEPTNQACLSSTVNSATSAICSSDTVNIPEITPINSPAPSQYMWSYGPIDQTYLPSLNTAAVSVSCPLVTANMLPQFYPSAPHQNIYAHDPDVQGCQLPTTAAVSASCLPISKAQLSVDSLSRLPPYNADERPNSPYFTAASPTAYSSMNGGYNARTSERSLSMVFSLSSDNQIGRDPLASRTLLPTPKFPSQHHIQSGVDTLAPVPTACPP